MRVLAAYGALAAAVVAVRPFLGSGTEQIVWTAVVGAAASIAVVAAARIQRLPDTFVWKLVPAGIVLLVAADVVAGVPHASRLDVLQPGATGARAIASVLVAGALLRTLRSRAAGRNPAALVDAGIVMVAVAAAAWLLIGEAFIASSLAPLDRANVLVDVLFGIGLAAVAARLLLAAGLTALANIGIGLAVTAQVLSGLLHAGATVHGWQASSVASLSVLSVLAGLLWGAATLHPSIVWLAETPIDVESGIPVGRLVTIGVATAVTATTMIVHAYDAGDSRARAAVLSGLAMLGLLIPRVAGIIAGYERSVEREHVLREGAASLVAAESHDDIARVVAEAAMELAGGSREALVEMRYGGRPDLSNVVDAIVVGSDEISDAIRGELRLDGRLGRIGSAHTIVVPVILKGRLAGILRLTGRRPLPAYLRDGLQTLASQAVLALETADLAEVRLERQSEARFRSLVQNSKDLIAVVQPDLTIRFVTPSVEAMLGYTADSLVGTRLDALMHPDEVERVTAAIGGTIERELADHEFRLLHRDGRWRLIEGAVGNLLDDPSVRGLVLTAHDVTDRRALEDQLAHHAFHDSLTGLPNRALFGDRVTHALDRAARSGHGVAVLFIDVDDFKTVNDSLGHGVGDELLVAIAGRLSGGLRAADTAARLGGDEFGMLLEDADGIDGAVGVARRVLDALARPVVVGKTELIVRASIGIVIGRTGQDAGELLRNADVAMYRAKSHGGNRFEVFEPAMHLAALTRLQLKADLERAFQAEEFHLEYQPIVALETGAIVSVEALLRWTHPERGTISPLEFIPLAEETGLIGELGDWVLRNALSEVSAWRQALPENRRLGISVNISGRQLQSSGFVEGVTRILAETTIDPADVILEITESTLMDDVDLVVARLTDVKQLGVRLAVDDFGTGFSSLGYLQRFPVDILKIAKPFVDELRPHDRRSRLVQAVISLASSLNLDTIAEGIELPEQRTQLLELGCSLGQGYLFARPQRSAVMQSLLGGRLAA